MQPLSVLQALLLLFVVAVHGSSSDEDIQLSEAFGGFGGVSFSDIEVVEFGQTACSITINAEKRITAVVLRVTSPAELTLTHGGSSGTDHTLTLGNDEYVKTMEVHWGRKGLTTRVFYLRFTTNRNNSVSAGTPTDDGATVTAPKGFQLSGFFGRSEGEVDQLGAIWTRINAKTKALRDTMGSACVHSPTPSIVIRSVFRKTTTALERFSAKLHPSWLQRSIR
ncbi:hypothetical protein KRP22_003684 [Phytophthora ramorum]|nr:Secreted RxLR effector protein 19 [Phytophthora ramorum]